MNGGEHAEVSSAAAIHNNGAGYICRSALLGIPSEERIIGTLNGLPTPVSVGRGAVIMAGATIFEGVRLGSATVVEDGVRIGTRSVIGDGSRLIHRAHVCDDVHIGSNCRVAGFICDSTVVEDDCTVMGTLVHRYDKPDLGWWETDEPAPVIRHHSVVGMGALLVGGIEVGPHAYVVAGATISRSVPAYRVAVSNSRMVEFHDWPGRSLRALYRRWTSGGEP